MSAAEDSRAYKRVVASAFLVAIAMIAQQLAGKAIRDAYFLTIFDADVLPRIMTVASIISIVAVFGVMWLYRRYAPARIVPVFFLASAGLFVVEWWLTKTEPELAAATLYIHTTSFGAVAISGFWSVMNERFDPYTAKRVIARVAGGATLGGILGGLAAWQAASSVSIPTMLLVLCGVNVFSGVLLATVGSGPAKAPTAIKESTAPWTLFEETPYLGHLALLVAITALGTAGFDYVFKATAAAAFDDKADLVSFFALFYLVVGVSTFVLQNLAATRLVRVAGLSVAIATLPAAIFLFGGLAFLVPGLVTIAMLRGSAATVESSFYRSGYELLYTPLPPEKKRPAKTLIDVGGDKLGAAIGGAIAVFLVGLAPNYARPMLIGIALVCAVVGVWLARRLAKGYVDALEDSLASGRVDLDGLAVEDAATRAVVERTMAALDRRSVLPELSSSTSLPRFVSVPAPPIAVVPTLPTEDPSGDLRAMAAFAAGDHSAIRWALARKNPIPHTWIPSLVPLLANPTCSALVEAHLAHQAPACVGTLVDALLSRRTPLEARRRIASILGRTPTARSAQGLVFAFSTEPFEIRFRAACALSAIKQINPLIVVREEAIFEAAKAAVVRARINFFGTGTLEQGELSDAGVEAGRTVAYCIRLFSVVLPQEPLDLALDALGSDHRARRGTGLEYLENVLPADLKERLFPFFKNVSIVRLARRDDHEILADIAREEREGLSSLERLKAKFEKRTVDQSS